MRFLIYRCDSVNAPFPPALSEDYIVIEVIYGNGREEITPEMLRRVRTSDCGSGTPRASPKRNANLKCDARSSRGFVRKNYRDINDNSYE